VRTTVSFSVESLGSGPLFFQWRRESEPILDATNATFTLINVQTNQAGHYDVVLRNPAGVGTSQVAILSVLYVPTFEEALETTNLVWETSLEHPWTTQTTLNHDGEDAVMSASLNSLTAESWLQTTFVGPVELNFGGKDSLAAVSFARTGPMGSQTLIDSKAREQI
jgi:hypothetical protein